VADLGVSLLTFGEPDRQPAGRERCVR